jgi:nitrogen fixation protein NifX
MTVTRLAVVPAAEPAGAIRVAFASGDRRHVDQHFGSAVGFCIYAVSAEAHECVAAVRFPPAAEDGDEDKLAGRMAALAGCAAVYVQAVGSSAIHRLLSAGVQPVKVPPGLPIAEALSDLKREIALAAAPWIARALKVRKDPSRFDAMLAEEWDE